VYQSRFPTALDMVVSFLPTHYMSETGVYLQHCLTQKQTSEFYWIFFAVISFSAEAKIHNPMVASLVYEVLNNLGG